MENYRVPADELTGESNLAGRYRISFNVNITEDDCLALSDIVQSMVSGFDGHPVLYKISDIGLEKIDKDGKTVLTPKNFKAGDLVQIKEDVTIKVSVGQYNNIYIVGAKSLSIVPVGDMDITISKGTQAVVNQITAEGIELIDFDSTINTELMNEDTGEFDNVTLNLESVIFLNTSADCIDSAGAN